MRDSQLECNMMGASQLEKKKNTNNCVKGESKKSYHLILT